MARLIDADKVRRLGKRGGIVQWRDIENAPTIDAIEVVRCKDCIHRDPEDHKCDCGALERAGCVFPVADDYFCECGEKKR